MNTDNTQSEKKQNPSKFDLFVYLFRNNPRFPPYPSQSTS